MEDKLTQDITQTGALSYKELQSLNNQNALNLNSNYSDYTRETSGLGSQEDLERALALKKYYQNAGNYNSAFINSGISTAEEFYESGYGNSRFDKNIKSVSDLPMLEENRAESQSYVGQLTNGILKMGVIAATTFADNFIGTAVGALNLIGEAASGNIHSGKDALNAFVRNPFSVLMQDINNKAEEWIPNYYTEEEKNSPWYTQWWHANFIGDHFLKNTGFMLGAAASAKVSAGALSKIMGVEKARDVFRGTALAAGAPDATTAKEVLQAYKTGQSVAGLENITESLAQAAKNLTRAESRLKAAAIASGSFGESRMEAISNSGDDFNKNKAFLDQGREQAIQNIIPALLEEQPGLFTYAADYDAEGKVKGYRPLPKDPKKFQEVYDGKVQEIDNTYNKGLKELSDEQIDYSNTSFLLNFLLTFGEGYQLFGDAITGGYTMNRAMRDLVTKKGDSYEALRGLATKKVLQGVASPFFEGTQEMFQQGVSVGLSRWEGQKFNNFYGKGVNPEGLQASTNWLGTMANALGDVYADPEQWENFTMGFLTALLPIPGRAGNTITTDAEGKPQVEKGKIQLSGEFWDSLREARQIKQDASATAKALNDIINSPEKRAQILGMVRHIDADLAQTQAVENGDKRTFKDAEFDKFINMALTFSQAGKAQDFLDLVEASYTVEEKDIEGLKALTMFKDGEASLFDGMKDSEIIDYFAQKKGEVMDLAKKIQKVESDITTLYGDSRSDAFKQELIYDIMAVDNREQRIKEITANLLDYVNSRKQKLQDRYGYDVGEDLKTIQDLNVFFGDEAGIDKLNELINQASTESEKARAIAQLNQKLSERTTKRRQLSGRVLGLQNTINRLEAKLADGTITDEERKRLSQIKRRVSRAKTDISRIADTINNLKGYIEEESDRYNPELLTTTQDLGDLLGLLINREFLLHRLNALSDRPYEFENGLYSQISNSINSFQQRKVDRVYDEFSRTRDLSLLGRNQIPFSVLKAKVEAGNDEGLKGYLDAVEKYSGIFKAENSQFDLEDPATSALYRDIQEGIKSANSVEQADAIVNELLSVLDTTGRLGPETSNLTRSLRKALSAEKKVKDALTDTSKKPSKKKTSKDKTRAKLLEIDDIESELEGKSREELLDFIDEYELNGDVEEWFTLEDGDSYFRDAENNPVSYADETSGADEEMLRETITNIYNELKASAGTEEDAIEEEEGEEEGSDEETADETPKPKKTPKSKDTGGSSEDVKEDIEPEEGTGSESKPRGKKSPSKSSGPIYIKNSKEFAEGNAESNSVLDNGPVKSEDALAVNRQGAKYDFTKLKDPKQRKAVLNRSRGWARNILENAGVQEFLDSGNLAVLQQEAAARGEKLKLRFVQIRGNEGQGVEFESVVEANAKKANTIFIAVEIPKDMKSLAPNARVYYDLDGKGRTMQLLGEVSEGLGMPRAARERLSRLRKAVQLQTSAAKTREGKIQPFAASLITTDLEWIFTGRIVKSDESTDLGTRDLLEIFTDKEAKAQKRGEDQLQIVVKTSDFPEDDIVFGADLDGEVVELNKNRPQTGGRDTGLRNKADRVGTVWIRTKEADGKVYYKGVKIRNFDENYTADDSPIAKGIKGAITNMVKANANWRDAAIGLQKYLYVDSGKKFYIDTENRVFRIGSDSVDFDSEDAVQEIYDLLKQQGYRFSLGLANLSVSEILDSHILYTDLARLHNVNSSFLVSEVDVQLSDDEKSVEGYDIIPSKTVAQVIANERIHTGRLGIQGGRDRSAPITLAGRDETYAIYSGEEGEGNTFWIMSGDHQQEEITDPRLQFLIEFKFLIDTNRIDPVGYVPADKKTGAKRTNIYMLDDTYMTKEGKVLSVEDRKNLRAVKAKGKNAEAALAKLRKSLAPKEETEVPVEQEIPNFIAALEDDELSLVVDAEGELDSLVEQAKKSEEDFKVGDTVDFRDPTTLEINDTKTISSIDTEEGTIHFEDGTSMDVHSFLEMDAENTVRLMASKELEKRNKKKKADVQQKPKEEGPAKPTTKAVTLPGKRKVVPTSSLSPMQQLASKIVSTFSSDASLRSDFTKTLQEYGFKTLRQFEESFEKATIEDKAKDKLRQLLESSNPDDQQTALNMLKDNIECWGIGTKPF